MFFGCVFFQAEDGIRDLVRSRGLGDVYKRQPNGRAAATGAWGDQQGDGGDFELRRSRHHRRSDCCLLYTSDAADERSRVDLGGRRILKNKTTTNSER